jgi:ElaB/YqjD/DUF883 family membrane-anchored ribosome-binding protein
MADEPEVIRDHMQDTRTALTEKLEALEQTVARTVENTTRPVKETVQSVTEATKETVSAVKDTVQQLADTVSTGVEKTVDTVKDTFNLSRHVQRHPWGMMFGSAAAGFLLGRLLPSARDVSESLGSLGRSLGPRMASASYQPSWAPEPRGHNGHDGAAREGRESASATGGGEGILSGLMDTYHDEVEKLKGMGIAAVMGVVRDLVQQSVKGEIGDRVAEWMNGLTEKMGGRPFTEPVLKTDRCERSSAEHPAVREDTGPLPGR